MKKDITDTLIGKTKEEAILIIEDNGYEYRIIAEDWHSYMVTMDAQFNRINLTIESNKIIKANFG